MNASKRLSSYPAQHCITGTMAGGPPILGAPSVTRPWSRVGGTTTAPSRNPARIPQSPPPKHQARRFPITKPTDGLHTVAQHHLNHSRPAVPNPYPNHLGRPALQCAHVRKIGIPGDNRKPMGFGIRPNLGVIRLTQSNIVNMLRVGIQIGQQRNQSRRKVLVQKQLHAITSSTLRSRSAAKERHARMSCSVK